MNDEIRIRVAAIVEMNGLILVQRPVDEPDGCYAFIGGQYEAGDDFIGRIKSEFLEETNAKVIEAQYLFVVENRFEWRGVLNYQVEHYLSVRIDREDVKSNEAHLRQCWLPIRDLARIDLRPHVVRDAIVRGDYQHVRCLKVW